MTGPVDPQSPSDRTDGPGPAPLPRTGRPFEDLVELMARLRTPGSGCPWDLEQTFETISRHTIEEAYEVADAISRRDMADLRGELGDLLFQTVFHSRMAEEAGAFSIGDVIAGLVDKMEARHPHVFGDARIESADDQTSAWEAMKAAERASRRQTGALDGVALGLPALMRAEKLAKRAARVGFDWPDAAQVLDKLDEEVAELKEAVGLERPDPAHVAEELGDLLFVIANLCRKLGVDAEGALRGANDKFTRRFSGMEALAEVSGRRFEDLTLAEQEALWTQVKVQERSSR